MSVERVASLHAVAVMGVRLRSVRVIGSLSAGKSFVCGVLQLGGVLLPGAKIVKTLRSLRVIGYCSFLPVVCLNGVALCILWTGERVIACFLLFVRVCYA